jgi:hypothetical protein
MGVEPQSWKYPLKKNTVPAYLNKKYEIVNLELFGKYVAAVIPIITFDKGEVIVAPTQA